MSLYDVEKKLYKKETDQDLSKHEESEFDPRSKVADPSRENFVVEDAWEEKRAGLGKEQKKAIRYGIFAVAGILILAASVFIVVRLKQTSFSEDRVVIAVNGPKDVQSGTAMTYEISYKNDNRAALENSSLAISFPENFKPEDNPSFVQESTTSGKFDLGKIKGRSEGKVVFRGKAFSPKGSLIYIKASFAYQPSNFNSQFVLDDQLGVNIISFPVTLEILAPQNLASGDELVYLISYKNSGQEDFDSVKLVVSYPGGFSFSKADPKSSEGDNIWYIGRLSAGQEGKITISGKLDGERSQAKVIRAEVGAVEQGEFVSYNSESAETKIEASPLSIYQTINNLYSLTARAGDSLKFEIFYKNEGNVGLKDVIVTEKLESAVLDYSTLDLKKGSFNLSEKMITWKASDFPELANLAPGKSGAINFSIKVKEVIPMAGPNDKNYVISSVAKIDSPDIQTPIAANKIIAGNKIDVRLNSKLSLKTQGFYKDSLIENSGPIPPVAEQETTYAIHWSVLNVSNDLADAKVETILPTGVVMTGKKYPEDANLSYNERTNSLAWDIGNIPAGTGILTPEKEIVFQVKVRPSVHQVGESVPLTGYSTFSGKDLFTGELLSVREEGKNSILREDISIGENFKVAPAAP